jgi:aminoglycoside 6-adenylyltransferase
MCDLFRQVAVPIAERYGFSYPHDDAQRVSAHLRHVRTLPKAATAMY